jgi:hypothetical protein
LNDNRLIFTVIIKLEGGTEEDFKALEEAPKSITSKTDNVQGLPYFPFWQTS